MSDSKELIEYLNEDKRAGIYILRLSDGRAYVGQSTSIDERLRTHARYAYRDKRPCASLPGSVHDMWEHITSGGSITSDILELCDESVLDGREECWIQVCRKLGVPLINRTYSNGDLMAMADVDSHE